MTLRRFGESGAQQPGVLDASGILQALSVRIADVLGSVVVPVGHAHIAAVGRPGRKMRPAFEDLGHPCRRAVAVDGMTIS